MNTNPVPPRVLYAEDDENTRELFKLFFSQVGWQFEVVTDGTSALKSVAEHTFDVVITDLRMPGLDGLELLRHIRHNNPAQAVIVVTASGSMNDLLNLMREGATDIIQKPVDFDTLQKSVTRVLSRVRQHDVEHGSYKYIASEHITMMFTSKELSELKLPLTVAERLLQAGRIDLNLKLRLDLAFQEALTNSLEHGNLELESAWKEIVDEAGIDHYSVVKRQRLADPVFAGRLLTVRVEYSSSQINIKIEDQGRGWGKRRAKRSREELPECHGRGLSIIYATMDKVRYSKNGRCLTMVKHLA